MEPIRPMPLQAILAGRAFTPHEEIADAVVLVEGGTIVAAGRRDQVTIPAGASRYDARALTVAPGFVDVHIHGAGGHDVMEGTAEALETVTRTVSLRGTTSLVATTVTASAEQTCRAVGGIARWMKSSHRGPGDEHTRAEVLGIHFEGPFISPARRGVHPQEWIVPPSADLLRTFLAAAEGTGRILTLAPELPGALELISAARAAGLVVSMGHTDASYAQAMSAIERGAQPCRARLQCHAAVRAPRNGRDWRGAYLSGGHCGTDCRWRARGRGGDATAAGRQRAARRDSGERRHLGYGHARWQTIGWAPSM